MVLQFGGLPFFMNSCTIDVSLISLTHLQLFAAATTLIITLLHFYFRSDCVYLIDFDCYLPPDSLRVPVPHMIEHFELSEEFNEESIIFLTRASNRSGIGPEACMPIGLHQIPPDSSLSQTREEVKTVLFTAVKDLFSKHDVNPKNISIIVSNCSLFCPTPSITAAIVNEFGFRSNVKSISLSGMGCSSGILAVHLAKDLLKVHKNSLALVVSMEVVNPNGYRGQSKSMLLTNVLFRMGGVALLLSNRKKDRSTSKYELQHLVRTHLGSDDQSYRSVIQEHDEDGFLGVSLSRSLVHVASKALRINISDLAPKVLPYTEQFRYGFSILRQKLWPLGRKKEAYMPNFKRAFEHFCIHAGGRAVIDAVETSLRLQKEDADASRMTLYRFGNTSSSSVWYELCYLEAKGKVKKGDRVWQIAFGSGFKCNSAVWRCISDSNPRKINAWSDRIDLYPMEVTYETEIRC